MSSESHPLPPNYLYTMMKGNKDTTKGNIQTYLSAEDLTAQKIEDQKSASTKAINQLSLGFGKSTPESDRKKTYSSLIEEIETLKENKAGILRIVSPHSHTDGSRDLIRDARLLTSDPDSDSPESYTINYINMARASEMLIDEAEKANPTKGYGDFRQRIRERVKLVARSITSGDEKIDHDVLKELTNELIEIIGSVKNDKGNAIFPDPAEALNDAKELASLDSPHYHISTITDIEGNIVVESDVMALGSTKEIRSEFQKIAEDDIRGLTWFTEMREPMKSLVKTYAKKFIDGRHIIPTQLSNIIGIRNTYAKLTMVKKKDEKDGGAELETILDSMHCGSPVFLGPGGSKKAEKYTAMTMRQYRELLTPDGDMSQVGFCTLNSSGGESADRKIVKYIQKISKQIGAAFHVLPINIFRYFSRSHYGAIQDGLKDISNLMEKLGHNKIAEFLKEGDPRKLKYLYLLKGNDRQLAAEIELKNIEDPKLRRIIIQALEVKSLLEHGGPQKNLEIAARLTNIEYSARKGVLFTLGKKYNINLKNIINSVTFCKSGKDRTGLKEVYASTKAVCDALDVAKDKVTEIFYKIARSGHAQTLAGRQGGTFGCHGLKGSTRSAMPKRFRHFSNKLFLRTADFNRLKKRKSKKTVMDKLMRMQKATSHERKGEKEVPSRSYRKRGMSPRTRKFRRQSGIKTRSRV